MIENAGKFLAGLLVYLISCNSVDSLTTPTEVDSATPLTEVDYTIYSAYLNDSSFYKNVALSELITIADSTTINPDDIHPKTPWSWVIANLGDHCLYLKDTVRCRKAQDPVWPQLFEKVKQSSHTKKQRLMPAKFKVRYPLQLLSEYRKQPSDRKLDESSIYYMFSLSKIAYNTDKTKALFFGSFICGGLCGRGELIMLEKVGQTWAVIDTFRFWIS